MKKIFKSDFAPVLFLIAWLSVALVLCATVPGCATRPGKLPNVTERKFYDVETNWVPKLVTVSASDGTRVLITNQEPIYALKPRVETETALRTASGVAGSFWGLGGLASTLVAGAYHLYAQGRNRKVTEALVQGTETALEVIRSTPQGDKLRDKTVDWLQRNQQAVGVLTAVTELVKEVTDNATAQSAAAKIHGSQ